MNCDFIKQFGIGNNYNIYKMSSTLQNSITVAPVGKKTREEVLANFENDLVRFESMSLKLYGHDQPLQFS